MFNAAFIVSPAIIEFSTALELIMDSILLSGLKSLQILLDVQVAVHPY